MVKNPSAKAGDAGVVGSIPELGRSPGVESSNLPQYSCLESYVNRGAWRARVHGVTKRHNWVTEHPRTYREF